MNLQFYLYDQNTMSKSIVPMPFVCKWSVAHPTTCRFKTREELIIHIDEHIINFYDKPDSVDSFYTCPWEGCMNRQSDIIELKGIKNTLLFC